MKKVKKYSSIIALSLCMFFSKEVTTAATTVNSYVDSEMEKETEEEKVTSYFDDIKKEIKDIVDSEEIDTLKKKMKEYVTTGIDFIFFDEPIKNVYFKDLTEEGKRLALLNIQSVIDLVNDLNPDILPSLGTKYEYATLFVNEKYLNVLDKIKDYLGEDNYNALGDIKDQIKGDIKDKISDFGFSLKKKYEDWRDKN